MEDVHEQAVSKRIFRGEAAFIIYFLCNHLNFIFTNLIK